MSGNKPYCDETHARLDADGNLPEPRGREVPVAVATAQEPAAEQIHELARACGHANLSSFGRDDLTTWSREMADLTGIEFAGYDVER